MGAIGWVERRTGQALLGAVFIKLGFDAAREPGPRVDKAAALGVPLRSFPVRQSASYFPTARRENARSDSPTSKRRLQ